MNTQIGLQTDKYNFIPYNKIIFLSIPSGLIIELVGEFTSFCKRNKLQSDKMTSTIAYKNTLYKGWRVICG